jgi:hypothetical protein
MILNSIECVYARRNKGNDEEAGEKTVAVEQGLDEI